MDWTFIKDNMAIFISLLSFFGVLFKLRPELQELIAKKNLTEVDAITKYQELTNKHVTDIADLQASKTQMEREFVNQINTMSAELNYVKKDYANLRREMNHAMQKSLLDSERKIQELKLWIKALVKQLQDAHITPITLDEAIYAENASVDTTPTVRLKPREE